VGISKGTTVLSNTGQAVGSVSVTPMDVASVPATSGAFSFSGLAVECEPTGAQFTNGAATISFTLNAAQWAVALSKVNGNTAAMTIQTYDPVSKSWVEVPTQVDPITHTVSAQVTHFSMYALIYMTAPASATPQTIGNLVQQTPLAPGAAGTAAPVNTLQAPPVTTPTSPGLPGIVVIGVVGFVGYLVSRKKQ
jgi:hypothetical protein